MSNPLDAYLEHSRRVASLLAWLDCELEVHEAKAMKPENAGKLWPMVGDLAHVEEELKGPLCFLSGMTEKDIENALNDEGRGDE